MSQRRKGPGRPLTSSTTPSLSPAPPPPPEPGLSFHPFPSKHEIFLRSEAPPSEPVLVSICLSYPPASRPGGWTEPGLRPRLGASPHLCCPSLPHPLQCLRGCSMFYVCLN